MALHATVEKLTTWKALLLLSLPHCPRECLFPPKVASSKVQPINVLNDMTPTVLRQAKEELRRTQSRLTQKAISDIQSHTSESISPQPSTSSVLPQATPVSGYGTDTHSPLSMGPQHCPPYGVPAYIPVSSYPPHVPPAGHMYHPGPPALSSHQSTSSQSHQSVAQYNYPGYTSTSHRSDPSHSGHGTQHGYYLYYPNPPPPPHGYPPYQWPAYSGYPPQPLPAGHPPLSSTAPPSHPKHGGNGESSGGQGERREST